MGSSDIRGVEALWAEFYPARYRVDSAMIDQNSHDCRLLIRKASVMDRDDGFIIVKAAGSGRAYARQELPHAHISALAFDTEETGFELYEHARKELIRQGYENWQFGGDWRHFFPGCPTDFARLEQFLTKCGMNLEGEPVHDLERDLADYEPPVEPANGARPCTEDDRIELERFLVREFPGRWHIDTMAKFHSEPDRIIGLFLYGSCEGFAVTQLDGDLRRYGGAVWSADLGANWGALGPIGVSESIRGQGFGDRLLAAGLAGLRDLGARRTIIDWTTLVDFYGKHGFEVSRTYRTYLSDLR
ncbi:MAG: GNAT family N-acetyltransferase [Armatimonadetes bacterium]|nr:GNAT family N-acetyltransferase [Armatimonadota bacterium]